MKAIQRITVLFIGIWISINSLVNGQPINNSFADVTLPSANAASLGKFGEVPVSYFTGVPSIGVDIYTVTQGPLTLPISVNYHASGIKVSEIASWVGLGWTLNAGGMISRSVVGIKDEHEDGWFNKMNLNTIALAAIAEGTEDSEPDIFSFNVAGYSGKFVFDIGAGTSDTIEPMLIPRQDIKITRVFTPGSNNLIGFKLILPDGVVCHFGTYGGTSALETSAPQALGGETTTGWYLLRMESHDQKNAITLSYATQNYSYRYPASAEHYNTSVQSACGLNGSVGSKYLSIYGISTNFNFIKGKRLSTITNSGGTQIVTFTTDANRTDVDPNQGNYARRLDKIEVRNGTSGRIYDFDQSYFVSSFNSVDNVGSGSTSSSWYKRLKLNSIQEKTLSGAILKNPYVFTYHGTNSSIPHRLSRAIDHWGFANGQYTNYSSGSNLVNVPPTKVGSFYYGSADRDSRENFMLNGVLNRVTYPTLGYTDYYFGANRYFYPIAEAATDSLLDELTTCSVGSGEICCDFVPPTPISSTTFALSSDEINSAVVDLKIVLGDPVGGNCNGGYKQLYFTLYKDNVSLGNRNFNADVMFSITDQYGTLTGGNYKFSFQTYNSGGKAKMLIKTAKEKDVGGLRLEGIAHRSKSGTVLDSCTYEYTEEGSGKSSGKLYVIPVYGDEVEDQNSYSHLYFRDMSIVPLGGFDGYHIGYERVLKVKPNNGHTEFLYTVEPRIPILSYPQAPELFLVENGRQDDIKIFNESGSEIRSTSNSYTSDYNALSVAPLKLFYDKQVSTGQNTCYYYHFVTYNIRTGYNLLDYQNQYADGMQYTRDYSYNTAQQLFPIKESIVNSDGKEHSTEYFYPHSYPNTTIRNKLLEQNRIVPWRTIQKVDGTTVDGDNTVFSFFTGSGAPTGSATALLYPYKTSRYEMSWNSAGTPVVDGWKLEKTHDTYQVNVGMPAEVTIDGWSDPLEYTWTTSGLLQQWAFIDHQKSYAYYPGSDLLQTFTAVDGTTLDFTWDGLMRLQDVTDCKGVEIALDYHYSSGGSDKNRINTTTTYPTLGDLTNKALTTTTFYDGLSKPIQTLRYQQHPSNPSNSIAEQIIYDNLARPTRMHEPKGVTHTPSSYAAALTDYTQTTYEPSPLARPTQVQPPSSGTLGRMQYQYGTNSANEVYDYVHSQYYAAGKLHKTVEVDANGHKTLTFKDILGRTILSRRENNSGSAQEDTYTLYDNKNRPYLILPPGTTTSSTNLIFKKVYSGDDQLLMSDAPDCDPQIFGYDDRELMIYRQDGNMDVNNRWYTIEYDAYGRSVSEGFSSASDGTVDEVLITHIYGTSGITLDKLIRTTAKLLNGPGEIRSYFYYDDCGRMDKETRNSTVQPGVDTSCVIIYNYDAADNLIAVTVSTPNGSARLKVVNKNEFDHAGRLIGDKIKIDNYAETLLSRTEYTVKEQVSKLKLGPNGSSPLQTVDYAYLPNRFLQRINNPASLGTDQFGLQLYYDQVFTGSGTTARKNGDISNAVWKTPQDANRQHFGFTYDYLNRLKRADYSQYSTSHTAINRYDCEYSYDGRGNMTAVERRGANNAAATSFGIIDDLEYTFYSGTNCLQNITDDYGIYGYAENTGAYAYDANGNMTRDPGQECDLYYNHLNKLDSIVLDNGSSVHFYCDARGTLHQKSAKTAQGAATDRYYFEQVELLNGHVDFVHHANGYIHMLYAVPDELVLTGSEPNNNHEYEALKITSSRTTSGSKTITYTAGEIELLQTFDVQTGSAVTANIENFTPADLATTYVVRDHLGNNRVFFWDSTGNNSLSANEIRTVKAYYPFGMDMRQTNNTNPEFKYSFGNKEELEYTKYLDFGARCMDVTTCRFTSVDRFSEKFAFQNPYSYAANSPMKYIDINGDSIGVNLNDDASQEAFNAFFATKEGRAFIGQFAAKGQTINGYTFESDGKYHGEGIDLVYSDRDFGEKRKSTGAETTGGSKGGTFVDGRLKLGISVNTTSADNSLLDKVTAVTHESFLHVRENALDFSDNNKLDYSNDAFYEKLEGFPPDQRHHRLFHNKPNSNRTHPLATNGLRVLESVNSSNKMGYSRIQLWNKLWNFWD